MCMKHNKKKKKEKKNFSTNDKNTTRGGYTVNFTNRTNTSCA